MNLRSACTGAAITLIGASCLMGAPIKARHGWIEAAMNASGQTCFVKPRDAEGRFPQDDGTTSHGAGVYRNVAACRARAFRPAHGQRWRHPPAGSVADAEIRIICR